MRFGLNAGYSGSRMAINMELVTEADKLGFHSVWAAEAYGSDAVTPVAWIAGQTQKIHVGTAIMQMPARTPAMTAMTATTLDQLSGLAYRVKFMDIPFHPDCFPCHIYPFASIFKKHPVVFLKDYNVAVRIATSQTRFISSIYEKSPMQSWLD